MNWYAVGDAAPCTSQEMVVTRFCPISYLRPGNDQTSDWSKLSWLGTEPSPAIRLRNPLWGCSPALYGPSCSRCWTSIQKKIGDKKQCISLLISVRGNGFTKA